MSIQDDHFDLEEYFEIKIAETQKGTTERTNTEAIRDAYSRIWEQFVDIENENEKLRPVVNAATTIVKHVINTHYPTN